MANIVLAFLLLSSYIALVHSLLEEGFIQEEFHKFKLKFNKFYGEESYEERYSIFKENLEYIHLVNSKSDSLTLVVGPFADLTYKEFSSKSLRKSLRETPEYEDHIEILQGVDLTSSVSWEKTGNVSPPANQGNCEAGYIFASIGSIESARSIKYNTTVIPLSEQQILDCDTDSNNIACNGGWGYLVYDHLMESPCIATARKYPYKGVQHKKCNKRAIKKSCTQGDIIGWKAVLPNNEPQLMAAVALQPVDSAVYAGRAMQHYGYGVLPFNWCSEGTMTNHEILIIGYNNINGIDYWIGKNSWGVDWGLGGYFLVERNVNNINSPGACLIASQSVYPQVA